MSKTEYRFDNAEKYCYPGTGVLVNKLGITDADALRAAVKEKVAEKKQELAEINGIGGSYKLKHLQEFHKFLLGDIFDWAGEVRDAEISDGRFCRKDDIESISDNVFIRLENEDYLKGNGPEDMADRLAYYTMLVDRMQPFRAGNRISIEAFFAQMGLRVGYDVDFSSVTDGEWDEAREAGLDDDQSKFQAIYLRIAKKIPRKK